MRVGPVAVVALVLLSGATPLSTGVAGTDGGAVSHENAVGSSGVTATEDVERGSLANGVVDRSCPTEATWATEGGGDHGERDERTRDERAVDPRIVELYPNPLAPGNVGEYVVVDVPPNTTLANWTITDGHTTAGLSTGAGDGRATDPGDDRTTESIVGRSTESISGRVAFSTDPAETSELTRHPTRELDGHLKLAADGDEVRLERDGRAVDEVAYDRAPLGEVWYRSDGERGEWWPRGATCLPASNAAVDEVTAFVLPDSPEVPLAFVRSADDRILLAGYTFTSERVAAELERAADRGVAVDLLVEASPVGGTSERTATVLDDLADAGVTVRVLGGRGGRYAYHHPKYAVVDDRAMVLTENWKPSGVGGAGSRGWGVIVDDPAVAAALDRVFAADFAGRDTTPWARHRETATFVEADPARGEFASQFDPEAVEVDAVEVLVAPDNAEPRLREAVASAEESILVEQVRIGDEDFPLLVESLEAARRGVEVRILLDASWYVEDENRELADRLQRAADEEDLPFEVRLVDPGDRFEKIHAKGVVVDGETVVLGSANWNNDSLRNNREVVLVLHGRSAAEYYTAVFESDWDDGDAWPLPIGLPGAVVLGLAGAGLIARRYVRFGRSVTPSRRSEDGRFAGGDRSTGVDPAASADRFAGDEVSIEGSDRFADDEAPIESGGRDRA